MNFALLIFLTISTAELAKIPDYIKLCHQNDPNITQCIYNSILHLKPRIKTGIPELNVISFEPMLMEDIHLQNGPKSASIEANLTELEVFGISNFEVEELKVNIDKSIFYLKIKLPSLYFLGNYTMNMQFLFFNLQGTGPVKGNLTNYRFSAVLRGYKIDRDGVEYLQFEKMAVKISIGTVRIRLENLFNGDETWTEIANSVINENSDFLLNETKAGLENSVALQCTDIANRIASSFPYGELFPN